MNHKIEISNIHARVVKQHNELLKLMGNLDEGDLSTKAHIWDALEALKLAVLHLDQI